MGPAIHLFCSIWHLIVAPRYQHSLVVKLLSRIVVKCLYEESGVGGEGEGSAVVSKCCLLLRLLSKFTGIESFGVFQSLPNRSRIVNPK